MGEWKRDTGGNCSFDLTLLIRSLFLERTGSPKAEQKGYFGVGAGVTVCSSPQAEIEEMDSKAKSFLQRFKLSRTKNTWPNQRAGLTLMTIPPEENNHILKPRPMQLISKSFGLLPETDRLLLVVNHRDSFVHNLKAMLKSVATIDSLSDVALVDYENTPALLSWLKTRTSSNEPRRLALVLSPGPGHPREYPHSLDLLDVCLKRQIPVLGVCLGLQLMVHHQGCRLNQNRPALPHGRHAWIDGFELSSPFQGRFARSRAVFFNSLTAEPSCAEKRGFEALACDEPHSQLAVAVHSIHPWLATQFHLEAEATESGRGLLSSFLSHLSSEGDEAVLHKTIKGHKNAIEAHK